MFIKKKTLGVSSILNNISLTINIKNTPLHIKKTTTVYKHHETVATVWEWFSQE